MLFHISEQSDISIFEPRPSEHSSEPVVWAVNATRLCNYLVPRDCPRVTFYANATTRLADVERFLGSSPAVVAIESSWYDRLRSCRLYCYHLPRESFVCTDASAGYFVSRLPVTPIEVQIVKEPMTELLKLGVELRFLPELWTLRDAVIASTLSFSIIRMRNAQPRSAVLT